MLYACLACTRGESEAEVRISDEWHVSTMSRSTIAAAVAEFSCIGAITFAFHQNIFAVLPCCCLAPSFHREHEHVHVFVPNRTVIIVWLWQPSIVLLMRCTYSSFHVVFFRSSYAQDLNLTIVLRTNSAKLHLETFRLPVVTSINLYLRNTISCNLLHRSISLYSMPFHQRHRTAQVRRYIKFWLSFCAILEECALSAFLATQEKCNTFLVVKSLSSQHTLQVYNIEIDDGRNESQRRRTEHLCSSRPCPFAFCDLPCGQRIA